MGLWGLRVYGLGEPSNTNLERCYVHPVQPIRSPKQCDDLGVSEIGSLVSKARMCPGSHDVGLKNPVRSVAFRFHGEVQRQLGRPLTN